MKNKKVVIVCLFIIIFSSITTSIYILTNNKKQPENKMNSIIDGLNTVENQSIIKDAKVNNLTITNVSLIIRDNKSSTYTAKVTNNNSEPCKITKLYVSFYIEQKEIKALGLYDLTIDAGESQYIDINIDNDLTKVDKIEYSLAD